MQTVFASTKEVIQANQCLNSDLIKEKAAEPQHTYIKSPAGIFTEAIMPVSYTHLDVYKRQYWFRQQHYSGFAPHGCKYFPQLRFLGFP